MNILVTGANGQLGSTFRVVTQNANDRYIFTDINEMPGEETVYLDVTNLDSVREIVRKENVQVIINCSGYTNVDKAEDDYDACYLLNATAPANLAVAIKEVNGLLVHISSDYVFGGNAYNTPCREEQKGTPTGVYGVTKLDGENLIQETGCDYIIIRTAWLYSEFGKNFLKTMLNLTATKQELNVVFDQTGTPTSAFDLAEAITTILSDYAIHCAQNSEIPYPKTGIYHYSNEGVCSWYDFTKVIAEYSGNTGCNIKPCHSDEFPSKVKRPAYSVLDKTKIKKTFGISIPHWTETLKICIGIILSKTKDK